MIIVIDGYNILKQQASIPQISDKERMTFIAQLNQYARRKNHRIILVFDGGPYESVYKEMVNVVAVIYSGARKTADDVIKNYISKNSTLDLLLVSSDRELNRYASRFGVASIDSHAFYLLLQEDIDDRRLKKSVCNKGQIIKLTESVNFELDQLMENSLGEVPIKQEDIVSNDIICDQRKMTKKDRTLLKKLKKL